MITLPWVRGLRPPLPSADWREQAAQCLLCTFSTIPTGAATATSEQGLGFPPSSYFYVGRADPAFSDFVCVYAPNVPANGGTTPFDSGGIWHGYIVASPVWSDDADRRTFVMSKQHGLCDHETAIGQWLSDHYSNDAASYVRGEPPKPGLDRIDYSRCTERAWTWEARVPKSVADNTVRLRAVLASEQQRTQLLAWIRSRSISVSQKLQLAAAVRATRIVEPHDRMTGILAYLREQIS